MTKDVNIFNNYLKLYKGNTENMKGVYQIYERKRFSIIPYEDVAVHCYDVHTGQYLGKVN